MEGCASHMYLVVHATLHDSIIVIDEVVWSTGSISNKVNCDKSKFCSFVLVICKVLLPNSLILL